jgi:hypothetical protein
MNSGAYPSEELRVSATLRARHGVWCVVWCSAIVRMYAAVKVSVLLHSPSVVSRVFDESRPARKHQGEGCQMRLAIDSLVCVSAASPDNLQAPQEILQPTKFRECRTAQSYEVTSGRREGGMEG